MSGLAAATAREDVGGTSNGFGLGETDSLLIRRQQLQQQQQQQPQQQLQQRRQSRPPLPIAYGPGTLDTNLALLRQEMVSDQKVVIFVLKNIAQKLCQGYRCSFTVKDSDTQTRLHFSPKGHLRNHLPRRPSTYLCSGVGCQKRYRIAACSPFFSIPSLH